MSEANWKYEHFRDLSGVWLAWEITDDFIVTVEWMGRGLQYSASVIDWSNKDEVVVTFEGLSLEEAKEVAIEMARQYVFDEAAGLYELLS